MKTIAPKTIIATIDTPHGAAKLAYTGLYTEDLSTALQAHLPTGEPYCTLTVCQPGVMLGWNEVLVKRWAENADFSAAVLAAGVFEDAGRLVQCGRCMADVWRLKEGAFAPHLGALHAYTKAHPDGPDLAYHDLPLAEGDTVWATFMGYPDEDRALPLLGRIARYCIVHAGVTAEVPLFARCVVDGVEYQVGASALKIANCRLNIKRTKIVGEDG